MQMISHNPDDATDNLLYQFVKIQNGLPVWWRLFWKRGCSTAGCL